MTKRFIVDYNYVKNYIEVESKSECILLSEEHVYKNNTTKLLIECKCGTEYKRDFTTFKDKGSHLCKKCSSKKRAKKQSFTYDYVKNYIEKESESGCKLLSKEYLGANEEILVLCACNEEYKTTFSKFKNAKRQSCLDCAGVSKWSLEKVRKFVNENSTCELVSDFFVSVVDEMEFRCICDTVYKTSFRKFRDRNQRQCPKCGREKTARKQSNSIEEVRSFIKQNTFLELLSDTYINRRTPIRVRCSCSREFETTYSKIHGNNNLRCEDCMPKMSGIEYQTYDFLVGANIPFKQEYRIDDCRHIHTLPFDFAVFESEDYKNLKFLIELQGRQHYVPVQFNGKSEEDAKKSLELCQLRDKIKLEYCKDNNIPLLVIPHWESENIVELIKTFL